MRASEATQILPLRKNQGRAPCQLLWGGSRLWQGHGLARALLRSSLASKLPDQIPVRHFSIKSSRPECLQMSATCKRVRQLASIKGSCELIKPKYVGFAESKVQYLLLILTSSVNVHLQVGMKAESPRAICSACQQLHVAERVLSMHWDDILLILQAGERAELWLQRWCRGQQWCLRSGWQLSGRVLLPYLPTHLQCLDALLLQKCSTTSYLFFFSPEVWKAQAWCRSVSRPIQWISKRHIVGLLRMPWNASDVASLSKLTGSRDKDTGSMSGSLISLFGVH